MEIEIRIPIVNESLLDGARFKNRVAEMIEAEGIGTVTGSGIGNGEMDLNVDVGTSNDAKSNLRTLLESLGVGDIATIREVAS